MPNDFAGLYGLITHPAPVNPCGYSTDLQGLHTLARREKPKLITNSGSLNLFPHPLPETRAIADEVGAHAVFDAAHKCGVIAGGFWANPAGTGRAFDNEKRSVTPDIRP